MKKNSKIVNFLCFNNCTAAVMEYVPLKSHPVPMSIDNNWKNITKNVNEDKLGTVFSKILLSYDIIKGALPDSFLEVE